MRWVRNLFFDGMWFGEESLMPDILYMVMDKNLSRKRRGRGEGGDHALYQPWAWAAWHLDFFSYSHYYFAFFL